MSRPLLILLAGALALGAATSADADVAAARQWTFDVYLDDRPIGEHRFDARPAPSGLAIESRAKFAVKVLGLTVYGYEHESDELWRDGCLVAIAAKTRDSAGEYFVDGNADGRVFRLNSQAGAATHDGCVGTFAYWDRRLLERARLLNPQTGEFQAVRVTTLSAGRLQLAGRDVAVERLRLTAPGLDITVSYLAGSDEWVALESVVEDGRLLRYRRSDVGRS
jgi:hypothetical protein